MKSIVLLTIGALTALLVGHSSAYAIANEEPGQADIVGDGRGCPTDWCGYLEDPDVTLNSYSVMAYSAGLICTATFIGPNVAISAGHCAPRSGPVRHYFYRKGSLNPVQVQRISCDMLVQSIHEGAYQTATDTAVLYCPDVSLGGGGSIPPGLLFGYLDFDPRPVTVGQSLYKLWWNTVEGPMPLFSGESHLLLSFGEVTDDSQILWGGSIPRLDYDTCLNEGASGSVGISPSNHRIIVGPHAAGGNPIEQPCGVGGFGVSAANVFELWRTDVNNYPHHYNPTLLTELGLTPTRYNGRQDKNRNQVFDVQEHLEALDGEKLRDHYWLGFESTRRNAQWQRPHSVGLSWAPLQGRITIWNATGEFQTVMTHPRLQLASNADFRGSVRIRRNSSRLGGELKLELRDASSDVIVATAPIVPPPDGTWTTRAFRLRTGSAASYRLTLRAHGTFSVQLAGLSLIQEGSIMDFDTFDKRRSWQRDAGGTSPFVLPEGRAVATNSDRPASALGNWSFAGLVNGSGINAAVHWTLRNHNLALLPGVAYRVCFHAKLYAGTLGIIHARLRNGAPSGTSYASSTKPVNRSWQRRCLAPVKPATGDNVLEFGVTDPAAPVLVDDITVLAVDPTDGNLIVVGDVDGDPVEELLTGYNSVTQNAAMYISDTGTPTGPRMYGPNPNFTLTAIAVGDVDGDGANELYTAFNRHDGHASIYRSTNRSSIGTLIYGPNRHWSITALVAGDVDSDGRDELFSAFNSRAGNAAIYRSDTGMSIGPGVFGPQADTMVTSMAIGDIVRDGTPEVYAATLSATGFTNLYRQAGTGGSWASVVGPELDTAVAAMTVADLDGDSWSDLLVGLNTPRGAEIRRMWGQGGGWRTAVVYGPDQAWRVSSLGAGDSDGDRRAELYIGFNGPTVGAVIRRLDDSVNGPGSVVWQSESYWRN